jgi:hypothetical protein
LTSWQGRTPLSIGVTGHRNLHPDELDGITTRLRGFFLDLQACLPSTPIVVLSELAEGADQLVTKVGLALGCESVCVLPLEIATYRAVFSDDAARAEFDRLLALGTVIELPGVAAFAAERNRGYAAAGRYIAEHATVLIALWDGVTTTRPGSTSDVMRARASLGARAAATLFKVLVRRAGQASRHGATQDAAELSAPAAIEAAGLLEIERSNAALLAARR